MAAFRSHRRAGRLCWLLWAALCPVSAGVYAQDVPARAADLRYGEVLYHYYQGEAFHALTLLAVARERGGIQGHGDHPLLVEGGLMLSWGMVGEAGRLFSRLLADGAGTARVTEDVRNRAWFYLGKVHYLSGHPDQAYESLQRVDTELLAADYPELYQEWCYLQAELARTHESYGGTAEAGRLASLLPEDSLWRVYLEYNLAMDELRRGNEAVVQPRLKPLLRVLEEDRETDADTMAERQALASRIRLVLAREMSARGRFAEALEILARLPDRGPVSEQGLYEYAVTAARAGEHGRAFAALEALAPALKPLRGCNRCPMPVLTCWNRSTVRARPWKPTGKRLNTTSPSWNGSPG